MTDWHQWLINQQAIAGFSSLVATRDLLRGRGCDGRLPLFLRPRSDPQTLLLQLPAGVEYVLGHGLLDATCPWCWLSVVTVPHLLRDCAFFDGRRRSMQAELRSLCMLTNCMDDEMAICGDPS